MSDIERQLREKLYRFDCPDPQEIGEFQLKLLSEAASDRIRTHLQTCSHCRRELAELATYLQGLSQDLEYSFAERVRIWIAERLPDASTGQNLAFGLRGDSGTAQAYDYQAGDAQITVEIQEDAHAQRTLLGLVLGIDVQGITARLWQAGEKMQTVPIDELGNFVFTAVEPGEYEIILSGPDAEYHIQHIRV